MPDKIDWKRKWPVLLAAILVLLVAAKTLPVAMPAFSDPYKGLKPKKMSLEGTLVCLPMKAGEPSTTACNLGLQTDKGDRYALDLGLYSGPHDPYGAGDQASGHGIFTPIERLSADTWSKYDIKGIFSVTDSFKVVK